MRIQQIETFTQGQLSIVRVTTDDGAEGWGQIAPFNANISALVLHQQVARHALGADPADIEGIAERCIEREYKFPWSYVCRAAGGIETALWDLRGRLEGKGVVELLGGTHKPIAAYGSSMSRQIQPEAEAERLARLRDEKGFGAFKIRVGKVNGHDEDQWPGRTDALVPTVREAIGDGVKLLVDGNSCYTPAKAIEVGRMLEDSGVCHFEEPCPYWELEWTAEVAAALDLDVAGGEQDNNLAQWRRMIAMDAVDVVQPDVCYIPTCATLAASAVRSASPRRPPRRASPACPTRPTSRWSPSSPSTCSAPSPTPAPTSSSPSRTTPGPQVSTTRRSRSSTARSPSPRGRGGG